jgi:hypothetical protein
MPCPVRATTTCYGAPLPFATGLSYYRLRILFRRYEKFVRALGYRIPPLYEGPPVPTWNATHDDIVLSLRQQKK